MKIQGGGCKHKVLLIISSKFGLAELSRIHYFGVYENKTKEKVPQDPFPPLKKNLNYN